VHADAQAGYAVLLKSEDQDGIAPWTQTADVTVRYNRIRRAAAGFNIAARPGWAPAIPAARFYVHDNIVEPFVAGDGIPVQLLGAVSDAVVAHNTFATANNQAVSFDGGATVRTVLHSNVLPTGQYGVKGGGTGTGATTLTTYMPGGLFSHNVLIGGDVYPQSCTSYPSATVTTCPGTLPSVLPVGWDARPVGADVAKVNAATASAVVVDGRATSQLRIPMRKAP
jgi:hypothetical protein